MEAVPAEMVLLIILGGNGIAVGLGGHGHVERRVEDRHLGLAGHHLLAGLNAHEVGRIVEGTQGDAVPDGLLASLVDDAGIDELIPAVEDPMAHSIDLIGGSNDSVLGIHQDFQDGGNGLGMGGHGDFPLHLLVLGGDLVGQTAVQADALTQALGRDDAGLRVHKLILQAGAAGVDNQNVHLDDPPVNSDFIFSHLVVR